MAEIVARSTRFHVQRLGSGAQKVVFIHGLLWDNLSSWYFTLAPHVAKQSEVLLYDMRGHGKSELTKSRYRLEDFVADLDEILTKTGFDGTPVHLIGNSFGGLVAIAYALTYPAKVKSIVLVDALSDADTMAKTVESIKLKGSERDREITKLFRKWLGRHEDPSNTKLADTAKKLINETCFLEEFAPSCFVNDEILEALETPVLAMFGGKSDLFTRGQQLTEILRNCEFIVFEEGSHVILWEYTDQICERTLEWIEKFRPSSNGRYLV